MLEEGVEKLGELLQGGQVVVKDKEETRDAALNREMIANSSSASGSRVSDLSASNANGVRLGNDNEYTHGDPSLSGSSLMDSSGDRDLEGDDSGNVNRRG